MSQITGGLNAPQRHVQARHMRRVRQVIGTAMACSVLGFSVAPAALSLAGDQTAAAEAFFGGYAALSLSAGALVVSESRNRDRLRELA